MLETHVAKEHKDYSQQAEPTNGIIWAKVSPCAHRGLLEILDGKVDSEDYCV